MSGNSHLFLRTGIAATVVALACWSWLPRSPLEKQCLSAMVGNDPADHPAITGNGTRESPWRIQAPPSDEDARTTPCVITLNDDPEAIFQSYPHAPIDLAVILSNIHRLGARRLACSPLLAWENPDPIGLTALEDQIRSFDSVLIAAPVTRGAVMQPLPEAFRRASLPLEAIQGNTAALPVVNRVSLPDLIYGGDNTLAGFQIIDSEPAAATLPLLARWDYRVVLAFPLLAAMQQLDIPVDQLQIRVGRFIQLGPDGPRIPINAYGHLVLPALPNANAETIPAEALIDAKPQRVAKCDFSSPLLCDRRGNMEAAVLDYNRQLPDLVTAISGRVKRLVIHDYTRAIASGEIYGLITVAIIVASLASLPFWSRLLCFFTVITACLAAQYWVLHQFHLWIPGLPACAGVAAAFLASLGSRTPRPPKGALLRPSDGLNYSRYSGK